MDYSLSNITSLDAIKTEIDSLNVETVKESAKYSPTTFLSSLGGSLSLYVGSSLISALEFFEFMIRILIAVLYIG